MEKLKLLKDAYHQKYGPLEYENSPPWKDAEHLKLPKSRSGTPFRTANLARKLHYPHTSRPNHQYFAEYKHRATVKSGHHRKKLLSQRSNSYSHGNGKYSSTSRVRKYRRNKSSRNGLLDKRNLSLNEIYSRHVTGMKPKRRGKSRGYVSKGSKVEVRRRAIE
jgi:hypothetical protein